MYASPGLMTISAMICLLPFAALNDWLGYFKRLPPREAELARAAHGVGLIVCGFVLLQFVLSHGLLPQRWVMTAYGVYVAVTCFGIYWLLIGAARAQIYGDRRLLTRSIMKVVVGCAVFLGWWQYQREVPWPYRGWIDTVIPLVYIWCWATGLTKIVICSRTLPSLMGGGNRMPHGASTFMPGQGLGAGARDGGKPRYRRGRE